MLSLPDETNKLGNYVSKLKNNSEKLLPWKERSATDTVPEFPRLTFNELNEITLAELVYHLEVFFWNVISILQEFISLNNVGYLRAGFEYFLSGFVCSLEEKDPVGFGDHIWIE